MCPLRKLVGPWVSSIALVACASRGHIIVELPQPPSSELPLRSVVAPPPPDLCGAQATPLAWKRTEKGHLLAILPQGPVLLAHQRWLTVLDRATGKALALHDVGGTILALRALDQRHALVVSAKAIHRITIPGMDDRTQCSLPGEFDLAAIADNRLALASYHGVFVVQRDTCAKVTSLAAKTTWISGLALSAEGGYLAIGGDDGTLEVVNLGDATRRSFSVSEQRERVWPLSFSADQRAVWLMNERRHWSYDPRSGNSVWLSDKSLRGYDWRSGKQARSAPPEAEPLDPSAASDGPLRCSLGDGDHLECAAQCPEVRG